MKLRLNIGASRRSGRSVRSHRSRRRPAFGWTTPPEVLESRALPSTIVVANTDNSGAGSLRSAVAAAQDGDTIKFSSKLSGRTISLQSPIDITTNLSIVGPANGRIELSGRGTTRVMEVDDATVSLSNMVITKGAAATGGGILDDGGDLTIRNSRLTSNVAYGSSTAIAQGGAIAQLGGSVTLKRDILSGNTAEGNIQSPVIYPPPSNPPGGIGIIGPIAAPTPIDNPGEADGGAVSDSGGELSLVDSSLNNNLAMGVVPPASLGGDAYGGAIFIEDDGQLQSSKSTLEHDRAVGGTVATGVPPPGQSELWAAGSAYGGAIAAQTSTVTLDATKIRLDAAQGGQARVAGGSFGGEAIGGGIYVSSATDLSMSGGNLSRDEAIGGEGSYTDDFVGVIPSAGGAFGGAIESGESSVSLSGATISHDTAHGGDAADPSGSGFYYLAGDAYGGAIEFEGGGPNVADESLTLGDVKLQGDQASGGNAERPGNALGGALFISGGQSVTISGSLLKGDRASNGLGYNPTIQLSAQVNNLSSGSADGGAVDVEYEAGVLDLTGSRVIGNRAVGSGNAVASGGALDLSNCQVELTDDLLKSNEAIGGPIVTEPSLANQEPGLNGNPLGQANGGAVIYSGSSLNATDDKFEGNSASIQVASTQYAPAGTEAAGVGGAIANAGGTISIAGGSFVANEASGSAGADALGGAIYSLGQPSIFPVTDSPTQEPTTPTAFLTATGVSLKKNRAIGGKNGEGGAIYNDQYSELDLATSAVLANDAVAGPGGASEGGGLYLAAISTNTLQSDQISRNVATTGSQIEQVGT